MTDQIRFLPLFDPEQVKKIKEAKRKARQLKAKETKGYAVYFGKPLPVKSQA